MTAKGEKIKLNRRLQAIAEAVGLAQSQRRAGDTSTLINLIGWPVSAFSGLQEPEHASVAVNLL